MGADIGPLAAKSEKRKKHDSRGQRKPRAQAARPMRRPAPPDEGCEQPERGKYGRRGTDRRVLSGLNERVQRVAEAARKQNGQPGETRPERLRQEDAEHPAGKDVAGKMLDVGVQRERGQRPPPFAGDDQTRLSVAGRLPVETEHAPGPPRRRR